MEPERTPSRLNRLLYRLPERFRWSCHNLIAHPLCEVLFQVGLEKWSDAVHDCTTPIGPAEPVEVSFNARR